MFVGRTGMVAGVLAVGLAAALLGGGAAASGLPRGHGIRPPGGPYQYRMQE